MAMTTYSDISSLVNNIQEGSLHVLRAMNVLGPTVLPFSATGMNPRKGYDWGTGNFRQIGESDDLTSTNFAKTERVTITPAEFGDQFFLSDQRIASDWENVRAEAVMEMGADAANDVDTKIASNFTSLTGDTINASGTLSWANITAGVARMHQLSIPGPYTCVLGDGEWYLLLTDGFVSASEFDNAPAVIEGMASRYYTTSLLGGVTFAISNNIPSAGGTAATGAIYNRQAITYDERRGYMIEPERDASRRGWELNATLWYGHGVWAANRGIQFIGNDVVPVS
jgi:hypothetical protein